MLSSCCRALQRMERRCYRHLTDCLSPEDVEEVIIFWFKLAESDSLFVGEEGAHGGDLGLPDGDG